MRTSRRLPVLAPAALAPAALALAALALAAVALVPLCFASEATAAGSMAPAPPGDVAVREELEAALRAGTRPAYDLFILRHPDHASARVARRERARLATPGRR